MSTTTRRLFYGLPAMRLANPLRPTFPRMRTFHDRWANDEDFANDETLEASLPSPIRGGGPKDRDIDHLYRAYYSEAESMKP